MASLENLLGLLLAVNSKPEERKRCPSCQQKEGDLFVLPTRLSVAGFTKIGDIPQLPSFASESVNALPLNNSLYCLQMLRQGYLYVLEHRDTGKTWRVFTSSPEGCLTEHSDPKTVNSTPPQYTCNIDLDGADASYISFKESKKIQKIYFLFSPDKILPSKLDYYQNEGLASLTGLTPDEIRHGSKSIRPDDFSPNIVEFSVAMQLAVQDQFLNSKPLWEFKSGERDNALKEKLKIAYIYKNRTLFYDNAIEQHYHRYLSLFKKLKKRQGAAIVVNDAIGITQNLNNRRHQALQHQMKPWMESKDQEGVSNEHRLIILNQLDGLKTSYREKRIARLLKKHKQMQVDFEHNQMIDVPFYIGEDFPSMSQEAFDKDYKRYEQQIDKELTQEVAEQEFQEKYWSRLSQAKIDKYRSDLEQKSAQAEQLAESRSLDLKTWLVSDQLLLALDAYDDCNDLSGIMFSMQVNMCLFGASSSPVLREVLDNWWDTTQIGRDNLNWRAYLNNNRQLIDAINEYITLQNGVTITEGPESDHRFEKVDKAVDLLNKLTDHLNQTAGIVDHLSVRGLPIAMLSISFADLMRRFLASTTSGAAQIVKNRLGNIILSSIDKTARELYGLKYNINGRSFTAPPSRGAPQINNVASTNYNNADLANTRIAMVVMVFSAYDFFRKISQGKYKNAREKAELTASFITTAAATFQIGISAIECCIGGNPMSRTAIVTYNAFGRIFLWGASLSAIAGLMSATFDFMDAYNKKGENNVLAIAYASRGLAIMALSVSQFLSVLGVLVPWLEAIIARSTQRSIWVMVAEIGLFLGRFALIESVATALVLINFYATFIILIVSVLIIIFDDDDLQKWLDRCCFSKDIEREQFDSLTEELTEYHQAIKGTF